MGPPTLLQIQKPEECRRAMLAFLDDCIGGWVDADRGGGRKC